MPPAPSPPPPPPPPPPTPPADPGTPSPANGALLAFARVADAAAATTSKLAKQRILADYFRSLDDADLPLAVRFAGGRAFAATDERVLGLSGGLMASVVEAMFDLSRAEWHRRVVQAGEAGEALDRLWRERDIGATGHDTDDGGPRELVTLAELARTFEALAATGRLERKRSTFRGLLGRLRHPREAAFASKIILGDLRTGVGEGVLQAAVAEAFGRDAKLVRRALLLVGDMGEVALLARHDRLAEARLRLFHPIAFMLATPAETAGEAARFIGRSDRPELCWLAEHKLDGIRAQVHRSGSGDETRIAIYSRTLDRIDASFPEIASAAARVRGEWLLDGEIVPWRVTDEGGQVQPFAVLQRRLGRRKVDAELLASHGCRFVAFDVLHLNGVDLLDLPLAERREVLVEMLVGVGPEDGLLLSVATSVGTTAQIEAAFAAARAARNEGLVLKDPRSRYVPGRRGRAWIKLKTHLPTLDVVVTAAEHGHGRRRDVLSDYTFAVWDRDPASEGARLLNVGKAFIGVSDEEIEKLTRLFREIAVARHGHVYHVPPRVVLEVAFDAIQRSQRHESGFALRFPRIRRIRSDKRPEDADRIHRVAEIFTHEGNFNRIEADGRAESGDNPLPQRRGRDTAGQLPLFSEGDD